jgi:hypothetical protein
MRTEGTQRLAHVIAWGHSHSNIQIVRNSVTDWSLVDDDENDHGTEAWCVLLPLSAALLKELDSEPCGYILVP